MCTVYILGLFCVTASTAQYAVPHQLPSFQNVYLPSQLLYKQIQNPSYPTLYPEFPPVYPSFGMTRQARNFVNNSGNGGAPAIAKNIRNRVSQAIANNIRNGVVFDNNFASALLAQRIANAVVQAIANDMGIRGAFANAFNRDVGIAPGITISEPVQNIGVGIAPGIAISEPVQNIGVGDSVLPVNNIGNGGALAEQVQAQSSPDWNCPDDEWDCNGQTIEAAVIVNTWEACASACKDHKTCAFWTFSTDETTCTFKWACNYKRRNANAISGHHKCTR